MEKELPQENVDNISLVRPELEDRQEEKMETSLRPQTLDEYIGQTKVKENMKIYIEAAKKEGKHLIIAYFMDRLDLEKLQLQI